LKERTLNPDLPSSYKGKKVAIVGLGVEGTDLAEFLVTEGAIVTLSDKKTFHEVEPLIERIKRQSPIAQVEYATAKNLTDDIDKYESVFVSQGVPENNPILIEANNLNIRISSMLELFMSRCPAPIVGITGSSGKTTTTALVAAILETANEDFIVGGNIGKGLLTQLKNIQNTTKVIVEMSHTQLLRVTRSPEIACVTNVTPNHLDQFSWDDYIDLKRNIIRWQGPGDTFVAQMDNPIVREFIIEAKSQILEVSTQISATSAKVARVSLSSKFLKYTNQKAEEITICNIEELKIPGSHNVENAACAAAITILLEVDIEHISAALISFPGVEHRLEEIDKVNNVVFINDSIATTPDRTLVGLKSVKARTILLMGGRDKKLPFDNLLSEITKKCRHVITFGEARQVFKDRIISAEVKVHDREFLGDAFKLAVELAVPGDCILLSPGGTSFDQYRTFEERGAEFKKLANDLMRESVECP
jgi:UDP-N-acetylmuramoylalanine--D-glutamate ligase